MHGMAEQIFRAFYSRLRCLFGLIIVNSMSKSSREKENDLENDVVVGVCQRRVLLDVGVEICCLREVCVDGGWCRWVSM